jgi:hypothetical protein
VLENVEIKTKERYDELGAIKKKSKKKVYR